MPTRRIFELTVVVSVLIHPVIGLLKLWSVKTLQNPNSGQIVNSAAQVVKVLT